MTAIDLGDGETVPRHHLPKKMLNEFDEASATLSRAQANVRAWIKSLNAMQAAPNFSGDVICNAVGQSGRTYTLNEVGGAVLVDQRDVATFSKLGFTSVLSGSAPTTGLRPGLVFMDTSLGEHMRYDGAAWAPVTLN